MASAKPAPGEEQLSSNVSDDIVEPSTALTAVNEKPNSHAVRDNGGALQEADDFYPSTFVL
jgi:hypothetical protein